MATRFEGTVDAQNEDARQTRSRFSNKKTSRASATVSFQAKPSVISIAGDQDDFEESL